MSEHAHGADCYDDNGTLVCTIPEHQHALICKSNPEADVEDETKWEATFETVELTGNWSKDLVALAETQIGYRESVQNFAVNEDGEQEGYTRYGAWYQEPYGDWSAKFCSFCLHYAQVDEELMPQEADCTAWIELLSDEEYDLYREVGTYDPQPGDLIFFDRDEYDPEDPDARQADQVGIVAEIVEATETEPAQIKTIEGDCEDQVCYVTYAPDDDMIFGYVDLPTNNGQIKIKSEPAADGAVAVITGSLPVDATAEIKAMELSDDQMTEYFGKSKASVITGHVAYDITIWANGEEWQPDETVSVLIQQPGIAIENNDSLAIAHVDGETDAVSSVDVNVSETGDVSFEAEGFSTYILYTVEFWYGEYMYSIIGNSELLLSGLFAELGIDKDVSDVVSVVFSDPALITVEQTETDWKLITNQPFLTEESLTVTFRDGTVLSIAVTDEYAPVDGTGWLIRGTSADSWYANDKLRKVARNSPETAHFYHTNTPVTTTYTSGSLRNQRYKFANGVNDEAEKTYDTIEFKNAYCYPNNTAANMKTYNICIRLHLNNVPSRTLRWVPASSEDLRTYLNISGGSPYLSVGVLVADSGTGTLPMYDIDWEMWLEDPVTLKKVDYIPLMGGSCFVGDEYVTVFSTDQKIYTNFPASESFAYNNQYGGWFHAANDYDDPDYYALGMVDTQGVVKGSYITPWNTNNFACELTANLYEIPITIAKTVQGENSHVNRSTTQFHFRAGYNDPFNNGQYRELSGDNYANYTFTKYNADNSVAASGTLSSGEFDLKDGQWITINGLKMVNTPVRIEEFTHAGSLNLGYYDYLDSTSATVDDASKTTVFDQTLGTEYVQYNITGASRVDFTNTLKDEAAVLTVTKDVVNVTTTQEFDFTATVSGGSFLPGTGYTIENGQIHFSLADEANLKIRVTPGATVTITETGNEGYLVKFIEEANDGYQKDGNSDSFQMDDDRDITVMNTPSVTLPETGGMGTTLIYTLGGLLIAGGLMYGFAIRRRGKRRGGETFL